MPSDIANSREIRVFLSSTFRDMEAERDYLMKFVFPEIRRYCSERQVSFTEIDLRWGITEEESKQGKTVAICLDEINRCRKHPPFFIGFLGERYGWIPQQQDLAGWLSDNNDSPYADEIHDALAQGISVTELEMQYAFLNESQPADHSRVFLRAEEKTKHLYQEALNNESSNTTVSKDDFFDAANGKLAALKNKLRASNCLKIDGYTSIPQFGEAVKEYLVETIDYLYPQHTTLSTAEMQTRAHSNYAASRRKTYVPITETRANVLADIETASTSYGAKQAIAITGLSGRGKSAFLADLESQLANKGWIFSHYTGADGNRSLDGWLSRLVHALKATDKLLSDIPSDLSGQWKTINRALYQVQKGLGIPLYLLVDAVNQFTEKNAFTTLSKLELPSGVVLITTTTQTIYANNWLVHELPTLNSLKRQHAIAGFLSDYRKELPKELNQSISQHPATAEPLFLRLLLEELRLHAKHETLTTLTQELLDTQDARGLFASILTTMNRNHQLSNHSELASRAVSLLGASRRGLHHEDLAKLLASDTDPKDPADNRPRLPDFILSPLLARLEVFCLHDDGRMYIMHDALLAVAQSNSALLEESRLQIVEHFTGNEGHAVAERVYQFRELGDTAKLKLTLFDLEATLALWEDDEQLLRSTLNWLGGDSHSCYWGGSIHQFKVLPKSIDQFGSWLRRNAYYDMLESHLEEVLYWRQHSSDVEQLDIATTLNDFAELYLAQNWLKQAEPLCLQALEIRQAALPTGHPDIAISLNSLGSLYMEQNRLEEAEPRYRQALEIRQVALPTGHPDIATSLNNLAELYQAQSRLEKAEQLYKQALEIRQVALPTGHPDIATSLIKLADVYIEKKRLDESEPLLLQALEIRNMLEMAQEGSDEEKDPTYCFYILTKLAEQYKEQDQLDKVEALYLKLHEEEQTLLPAGFINIPYSTQKIGELVELYYFQGRQDKVESLYLKVLEIEKAARPTGHPDMDSTLISLAELYTAQNRLEEAESLYQQALEISSSSHLRA